MAPQRGKSSGGCRGGPEPRPAHAAPDSAGPQQRGLRRRRGGQSVRAAHAGGDSTWQVSRAETDTGYLDGTEAEVLRADASTDPAQRSPLAAIFRCVSERAAGARKAGSCSCYSLSPFGNLSDRSRRHHDGCMRLEAPVDQLRRVCERPASVAVERCARAPSRADQPAWRARSCRPPRGRRERLCSGRRRRTRAPSPRAVPSV